MNLIIFLMLNGSFEEVAKFDKLLAFSALFALAVSHFDLIVKLLGLCNLRVEFRQYGFAHNVTDTISDLL